MPCSMQGKALGASGIGYRQPGARRAHLRPAHSAVTAKATENGAPPGDALDFLDTISVEELENIDANGPPTPLLDTINYPMHMKNLSVSQLRQLCKEIRSDLIHTVSQTGGHLGSSLGVVELTVAMHHVFNCPADKFIFDVGHQAYVHKMLTGRRKQMSTIRQSGGLSGFTKRSESEYDAFGAGHSSTSVSAGLGMAVGRDAKGKNNSVVSVIGDGAITGGMAYEAMNHAGFLDKNMIVILNDNQQVSLPTQYNGKNQAPVGALSSALGRLQANRPLRELREVAKGVTKQLPDPIRDASAKIDEYARGMISGTGSTLFEELGLYYIGPIDGHNMTDLVDVMQEVKSAATVGPVLIHVITEKGRGYVPAETASDKMHGVVKYDIVTGKQKKAKAKSESYTNVFADALIAEAEADSRVTAVHAAMAGGTGLYRFENKFPNRIYDVGIAEQHAITFAAGLACEGMVPWATVYSTFLQRGYDQVVHDVALQKLPVRFAMDRAGLVGADGATHAGSFDVTYMASLPHMVTMAPSNEVELVNMVATMSAYDQGPSCVRYPRGTGIGLDFTEYGIGENMKGTPMELGKSVLRTQGKDAVVIAYGSSVNEAMGAAALLENDGVKITVVDARFCKPLDVEMIRRCASEHAIMLTVEEGAIGGFAAHVMQFLALDGLLDGALKFRPMTLPDRFIDHGSQPQQLADAGIDAAHIARTVMSLMGKKAHSISM